MQNRTKRKKKQQNTKLRFPIHDPLMHALSHNHDQLHKKRKEISNLTRTTTTATKTEIAARKTQIKKSKSKNLKLRTRNPAKQTNKFSNNYPKTEQLSNKKKKKLLKLKKKYQSASKQIEKKIESTRFLKTMSESISRENKKKKKRT